MTIRRACEEPIRQIVNAGVEGAIIIGKIRESEAHFGYNAQTDKYEDLVKSGGGYRSGVLHALGSANAASIAGLMLTTEAMVCEIPEKKQAQGGAAMAATADLKAWTTKPVLSVNVVKTSTSRLPLQALNTKRATPQELAEIHKVLKDHERGTK